MIKYCQYPSCDREAVWSIKDDKETGSYLACSKHGLMVAKLFKKQSGKEPMLTLL